MTYRAQLSPAVPVNASTAVTNQPEPNETKPAEPKTKNTIAGGILTLSERISDVQKDLSSFPQKVDDGFHRQDNWNKFFLGDFKPEVAVLEERIKSDGVAPESRILVELARMEMRPAKQTITHQDETKAKKR
ncbi:hypothetical protein HOY80DRAFT_1034532 [Tuber brumale]|nr:hypothetical protein HOY80DRAFT_1034532 [Tuber brumale]